MNIQSDVKFLICHIKNKTSVQKFISIMVLFLLLVLIYLLVFFYDLLSTSCLNVLHEKKTLKTCSLMDMTPSLSAHHISQLQLNFGK